MPVYDVFKQWLRRCKTAQLHRASVCREADSRNAAVLTSRLGLLSLAHAQQPPPKLPHRLMSSGSSPVDLESRDLFRGPPRAPRRRPRRQLRLRRPRYERPQSRVRRSRSRTASSGASSSGRKHRPKSSLSRSLWAIGFHQPPTYYVAAWTHDGPGGRAAGRRPLPSRDRRLDRSLGEWDWTDYPHTRSPENGGLLVAQMILNNWDLKTSNNKVIDRTDGSRPGRASMWRAISARRWAPTNRRSGCAGPTCAGAKARRTIFRAFRSRDSSTASKAVSSSSRTAVRTSRSSAPSSHRTSPGPARLFSRLSDAQWHDAFRAGGYSREDAARYIARFKEKIAVGLALESR